MHKHLAKTDARFGRTKVFSVKRDGLKARGAIEREGGTLPDAGFENQSPNAQGTGFGFESGHEPPPQSSSAYLWRHIHSLKFGCLGIEKPHRAAADWISLVINNKERTTPVADLRRLAVQKPGLL